MDAAVPLLGRHEELAVIDALLQQARSGHSGVLVIEGEPGIGKSALLDHAVATAGDATVLRAAGIQSELDLSYGGLGRLLQPASRFVAELEPASRFVAELEPASAGLLRDILGLSPAPPALIRDRFGAGLATLALFAAVAEEKPLVVVVDDVHWMDGPTVEALAFAARRLYAEGVVVILARRPDVDVERLEQLPTMQLGGLGSDDARRLLERHGANVPERRLESLVAATGGNPLALIDLPTLLRPDDIIGTAPALEPVPIGARLQDAYGRRFRELSKASREALLASALLEDPDAYILSAALAGVGRTLADLGEAEDADLARLTSRGVVFRHPLIRSAIVQTTSLTTRRRCHRAIADALAASPQVDLTRRAWHLAAAATGLDAEAAELLTTIASDASLVGGFASASRAYERAAELSPAPRDRGRRFVDAATAAYKAGQGDRAMQLLDAARRIGDRTIDFDIVRVQGQIDTWQGRAERAYDRLVATADELVRESTQPDDVNNAARLLLDAVVALAFSGDVHRMLAAAVKAHALPADDPDTRLVSKVAVGAARLLHGDLTEGAEFLADSDMALLELAVRSPDDLPYVASVAYCRVILDMHDEVDLLTSTVIGAATNLGVTAALPFPLTVQAHSRLRLGAWETAAARAHQAAGLAADTARDTDLAYANGVLALIAAGRGQEADCISFASASAEGATKAGAYTTVTTSRTALGLLELGLGRPQAAIEPLQHAERLCTEGGLLALMHWQWAPELMEAFVRIGRHNEADAILARLDAYAVAQRHPIVLALTARCRGLAADEQHYADHFVESLEWHDKSCRPFERARTQLCFGERLRRSKQKAAGREQLSAALETFIGLGAECWADRARSELEATGRKLTPSRGRQTDVLTAQELQIAMAVAEGMSNREIATRLFLSRKTVEYHLRHVYMKLNVGSRDALRLLLAPEPTPA